MFAAMQKWFVDVGKPKLVVTTTQSWEEKISSIHFGWGLGDGFCDSEVDPEGTMVPTHQKSIKIVYTKITTDK